MDYSQGNNHLILTYILKNGENETLFGCGYCYVVDNPIDWSYTYCLPLLVITFGDGKPVNFLDKTLNKFFFLSDYWIFIHLNR